MSEYYDYVLTVLVVSLRIICVLGLVYIFSVVSEQVKLILTKKYNPILLAAKSVPLANYKISTALKRIDTTKEELLLLVFAFSLAILPFSLIPVFDGLTSIIAPFYSEIYKVEYGPFIGIFVLALVKVLIVFHLWQKGTIRSIQLATNYSVVSFFLVFGLIFSLISGVVGLEKINFLHLVEYQSISGWLVLQRPISALLFLVFLAMMKKNNDLSFSQDEVFSTTESKGLVFCSNIVTVYLIVSFIVIFLGGASVLSSLGNDVNILSLITTGVQVSLKVIFMYYLVNLMTNISLPFNTGQVMDSLAQLFIPVMSLLLIFTCVRYYWEIIL